MLFVAVHSHRPESCPIDQPEPVRIISSDEHAKKCGVKVLGRYIAPPEHQLFFILEANDYQKIVNFFRPMMKIGAPRIYPVMPLGEALETLTR